MTLRIAFAGTPAFATVGLRALLDAGFEVPLVLTQPDRAAGRGLSLQPSSVKQCAQAAGLRVEQPRSLKLDGRFPEDARAAAAALQEVEPDVMVVAAYGLLLPKWVLTLPRLGCLNIHASLLPRWRGAAPIQRAIEAGDAETGVTIMQMDEGLDTGAMLCVGREPIGPDDTAGALQERLASLGARLIVQALHDAALGRLEPVAQPAAGVTYAHKIDKAEARIDWREPAAVIERRVRAFDPAPGCHFSVEGQPVKLWRAAVRARAAAAVPGEVVGGGAQGWCVACGEDALELQEVQPAGGRRQPAAAFLRGRPVTPGQRLALPDAG